MTKYLIPLAASLILSSGVSYASSGSNQAVTACKSHIKTNVEGYKRAKLGKIRSSRGSHTISFVISSEAGRSSKKCVVSREDGTISLQ